MHTFAPLTGSELKWNKLRSYAIERQRITGSAVWAATQEFVILHDRGLLKLVPIAGALPEFRRLQLMFLVDFGAIQLEKMKIGLLIPWRLRAVTGST